MSKLLYAENGIITPQMFGAVGDGVADDTEAMQAAFDTTLCRDAGGYYRGVSVNILPGIYRTTRSLDMTNRRDVTIYGSGLEQSVIVSEAADGIAIDMSGSAYCVLRDFTVYGHQTNKPKVGLFMARSTAPNGEIVSFNRIDKVAFEGYYGLGAIALFSAELNTFDNIWIHPLAADGLEFGVYSSAYNDYNLQSAFTTLSTTASNSTNWMQHSSIQLAGNSETFIPVKLGRLANGFTVRDCFLHTPADYNILVTGDSYRLHLENVTCEGAVKDIIHFAPHGTASVVHNLHVDSIGSSAYTRTGIYTEDGVTLYEADIQNIRGGNNISAMRFYDVHRSKITNWVTTPGIGGISFNRLYHSEVYVPPSGITITTQELYNILHRRGGNGTAGNQTVMSTGFAVGSATDTARANLSKILAASKGYDPGSVANGSSVATTILPITGMTAGDFAIVSLSAGSVGIMTSAFCGNGTLYVTMLNRSGAVWSPGSITLKAIVFKTE